MTVQIEEKITIAYVVIMSGNVQIPIDADEVEKVMRGISAGAIVRVRRGVINPSFFIAITCDEKRTQEVREKMRDIERHNKQDLEYHGGKDQREFTGMKKLEDIFAKHLPKLTAGNPQKPLKLN